MRPVCQFLIYVFILISTGYAQHKVQASLQPQNSSWQDTLLRLNDKWLDSVWRLKKNWKIQVYYTKIDRSQNGQPITTGFVYSNDSLLVLDAANAPLGLVLLAMKKMTGLNVTSIDLNTTLVTESQSGEYGDHEPAYVNPRWPDGRPSIGRYISDLLLLHDDHAFNRLFEFVGPEYVQQEFGERGVDIRFGHRLPEESEKSARNTNKLVFYNEKMDKIYIQDEKYFDKPFKPFSNGFAPSFRNSMYLKDAHHLFMSVMMPGLKTSNFQFSMGGQERRKLLEDLSQKSEEIQYPFFDPEEKAVPFLGAFLDSIPSVKVFHNGGSYESQWAESVYVIDTLTKMEYFLSIGLDIGNDPDLLTAEYFIEHIGKGIFAFEKKRPRTYLSDLSEFIFKKDK